MLRDEKSLLTGIGALSYDYCIRAGPEPSGGVG